MRNDRRRKVLLLLPLLLLTMAVLPSTCPAVDAALPGSCARSAKLLSLANQATTLKAQLQAHWYSLCNSIMAAAGGGEANPAERQSIQLSKSTLKGLECQFYGSNTFDTFYPDPAKHKFCVEGKYSAYVLVQDLPESIFKLADRSLSDFENSDLEKFFDKHLPASIRRPKCKVGSYEVEEQTGGGSSSKQKVFTGIAEFESAETARAAIAEMTAKGPRKIMTKDDPDVVALNQVDPEHQHLIQSFQSCSRLLRLCSPWCTSNYRAGGQGRS